MTAVIIFWKLFTMIKLEKVRQHFHLQLGLQGTRQQIFTDLNERPPTDWKTSWSFYLSKSVTFRYSGQQLLSWQLPSSLPRLVRDTRSALMEAKESKMDLQ